MGCCCSRDDTDSIQDEPNSRTRLLQDTSRNGYQYNAGSSEGGPVYGTSVPSKSDEQTALQKVLQHVANKVIDVGAIDCQVLEDQECDDRTRLYVQSINKIHIPQSIMKRNSKLLLMDVPPSDKFYTAPPISSQDFNMMSDATAKLSIAMANFKVFHEEDLVVHFGEG